MAFNTYQASSNSFPVTIGFGANDDYIVYNNTKCPLTVHILPDSDGPPAFNLGPGESYVYHHGATAEPSAVNVYGYPVHTAVNAGEVVDLEPNSDGTPRVNQSLARLVVSGF